MPRRISSDLHHALWNGFQARKRNTSQSPTVAAAGDVLKIWIEFGRPPAQWRLKKITEELIKTVSAPAKHHHRASPLKAHHINRQYFERQTINPRRSAHSCLVG
jgi:hypothetical protein